MRLTRPNTAPAGVWMVWILFVAAFAMAPSILLAVTPSWWATYGVQNENPANDYAAVNQGQVKNIAVAAVSELDTDLAQFGGAGGQLDQLASTLISGSSPQRNDYAAINLGQLKALAQPFYDRLLALGYNIPPVMSGTYPWITSGLAANDYAMANLGQVKNLFSFDVTYSSAGNGIPDWWAQLYFPGQTINSGSSVQWSDGQLTILQAYQQGLNPVDFYNGQTPSLTYVSGSGQTGPPGGFLPSPLIVKVTDTANTPLVGAPITFTVTLGNGSVQATDVASPATTLVAFADSSGYAKVYFKLPNPPGASEIIAAIGTTGNVPQITFSETGAAGDYNNPFNPTNVIGNLNPDGSVDVTWTNNPDSHTPINIRFRSPNGGWTTVVQNVDPGTTSYHVPAQ